MSKETLQEEIDELKKIKQSLQMDIIELDDKILFQDFGVYQPQYNFATLDEYKDKLEEIREEQKAMIKNNTAAICNTAWKVQGSEKAGKKMIAENIKQALRNFNIECDLCIGKVKFSNYDNSKERIFKAFELQNKLNETNDIRIVDDYYRLKIKELNLAFEYQKKKQEEREELRRKREELREAEKVAREIEEKRKDKTIEMLDNLYEHIKCFSDIAVDLDNGLTQQKAKSRLQALKQGCGALATTQSINP